jgi:hypothetical protein
MSGRPSTRIINGKYFIILDSDEREVFSSSTIDYLIEQVQYVSKKLEGTE